ncbi:MAG: YdcH family protein [Pseudomonadota bacterium]
MLGEKHRLIDDFPEFTDLINTLNENDRGFSEQNSQYTALDDEIRKLELGGAPIGDDAMHKMKQQRAALKDTLYQYLLSKK